MREQENRDEIGLSTWKRRNKDEGRSRFFDISPKEEKSWFDHEEIGVYRSQKKPSTQSLSWRGIKIILTPGKKWLQNI
jgi:hypothetical protein